MSCDIQYKYGNRRCAGFRRILLRPAERRGLIRDANYYRKGTGVASERAKKL